MATPSGLSDCLAELGSRVAGELRSDRYSRILYSTDASIYQVEPHAVLIPRTVEDVLVAMELASHYEVPILARTSGSSLAGQAVNEALVIDMTRHLDRVLEIDPDARRVRVQPGVVLDHLNRELGPHGLQFGPDPASSDRAAVGGIVANNSTGAHSILYGMTADHVLATEVILSDGSTAYFEALEPSEIELRSRRPDLEGRIYRRIADLLADEVNREAIRAGTPRHWRRCGGYNLDRLFDSGTSFRLPQDGRLDLAKLVCGSEGTLAVMTEITLNLVPVPRQTALALVHFASLYEALTAVPILLEIGVSAVELLDHLALTLCRDVPEYSRLLHTFVDGEPNCILITEFHGTSDVELRAKIDRLRARLRSERVGATGMVPAMDEQRQRNVWAVRKAGLGLLMSMKGDRKPIPFIEDAAVPVEHLAEYIHRLEQFCGELGSPVAYYAHASAGCLHVRPLIDAKQAKEVAKLPEILSFAVELLHGYGGALSSEHGDGRSRSWINERFFGPRLYGLYREVKLAFDPRNLLNPGNIVDAPAMTEHLRFGGSYRSRWPTTHLDFSHEHGFDRAIEMCNGAGVCRKLTTGTLCPSFMATREEEHSTRGRANALRAVLSGRLPRSEWTGPRMYRVLDLCVECKACKAECPSSVDMGKIKFEFLATYHDVHDVPLRARLFGNAAAIGRIASGRLAPLANVALRSRAVRALLDRALGIARQRELPPFARQPFTAWFHGRLDRPRALEHRLVLLNDTFNTYHSPWVSVAATELLEAAGFEVLLSEHGCCGRPMISKGLVDEARTLARTTIARLAPLAEQRLPIIGLEPSCISALRDDYFHLLPGDSRVELVAAHVCSFEEYLSRVSEDGRLALRFHDQRRHLLMHGHCHQKALIGSGPSRQALSLPAGYEISEIDSGCCGMAGAFGYEREHYGISLRMAERRLLPAVRQADPDTLIVAAGVSCRQQIEHGTGRQALHPAEVLRQALI